MVSKTILTIALFTTHREVRALPVCAWFEKGSLFAADSQSQRIRILDSGAGNEGSTKHNQHLRATRDVFAFHSAWARNRKTQVNL